MSSPGQVPQRRKEDRQEADFEKKVVPLKAEELATDRAKRQVNQP